MRTNKIILSIAAPIIAIIPTTLATSCKSNYVEPLIQYELINGENLPEITPLEPEGEKWLNQFETMEWYRKNCEADPSLFQNDQIMASFYNQNNFDLYGHTPVSYQFGSSKAKFGQTKVRPLGFGDTIYPTLSFKNKLDVTYDEELGDRHVTRKLTLSVEYNDVIFLPCEVLDEERKWWWSLSILDPNCGKEAFWCHQYNINPWSITYSAIDDITEVIPSETGEPVEIHKCSYYSGLVNNANTLMNLWEIADHGGDHIEKIIAKNILCEDIKSTFLQKTYNIPSIRLKDLVTGEGQAFNENISFVGFQFIPPMHPAVDPDNIQILIQPNGYYLFNEYDGSRQIHIKRTDPGTVDNIEWDKTENWIKVNGTIETGELYKEECTTSYNFNFDELKFKIYCFPGQDPYDVNLNLHYNSIPTRIMQPLPPAQN